MKRVVIPGRRRPWLRRGILSVLLAIVLAPPGGDWAAAQERGRAHGPDARTRGETLVIGRVSDDPKLAVPRLEALANYLAPRLSKVGIARSHVVVAKSRRDMAELLRQGQVDLVSETPFSALFYRDDAGAEFLAREARGGADTYRTVFFARKGSGIRSIEDLRGKKLALEDPSSTSAFQVPLAMIRQAGLSIAPLATLRDEPVSGKVGYALAREEINILGSVAKGLTDAGAFSDMDWENAARAPGALRDRVEIFAASPPIVRALILTRPGFPEPLKSEVQRLLLAMADDADAKPVLVAYYRTRRFDPIDRAAEESLAMIERLALLIRDLIQ